MNLLPGIGFFEVVVIAIIALVVVGPRDLPRLMRIAGKFASKARRMAAEFTSAFQQMARESEMEDMRREIEALKNSARIDEAEKALSAAADPFGEIARDEAARLREAQTKSAE